MKNKTFKIFLASSGTLGEERKEIGLFIAAENKRLYRHGIFIELVVWEELSHSFTQDRKQNEFNKAMLGCDMVIALFFNRAGEFTLEEFNVAYQNLKQGKKPKYLYVYFSKAPIGNTFDIDYVELGKVQGLRKEIEKSGQIYCTYTSIADLKNQIKHEFEMIRELQVSKQVDKDVLKPTETADPRQYLTWLCKECGSVDIRGLQVSGNKAHRFDIEELYTPLYKVGGEVGEDDGKRNLDMRPRKAGLDEVVKSKHTVVIGDPGSGKSTFLRHVTTILCRTLLGEKPQAAREKLGLDKAPLPLFIRINELATHIVKCDERNCPDAPTQKNAAEWIIHYLAERSRTDFWGLSAGFFREKCASGEAMLLLDGLDEAPGRIVRERISGIIDHAVRAYDLCTVIVSSRPGGYEGNAVLNDFAHCTIAPFEEAEIRAFLRRWSGALYQGDERQARVYADILTLAVSAKPEIRRMAVNPVMLTALAVLYWNDKRLPDQRAELYESIITWLLRARQDKPGRILNEDLSRRAYQRLAYRMQKDPSGRLRAIDRAEAQKTVFPLMPGDSERDRRDNAARFIEEDEIDSGIIVSRGPAVEFWHLTFQEYLAARELSGMSEKEQDESLFKDPEKTVHNPDWRETLLLLVGIMYKQGIGKVNAFFSAMLDKAEQAAEKALEAERLAVQARCFGLMGAMAADLSTYNFMVNDKRYLTLRDDVMGIFDPVRAARIDVKVRCAAGDALGQAGDPRIGEDLRDLKVRKKMFVEIPAGEFWMGAQKTDQREKNFDANAYPDESPVHLVKLSGYSIARYPVMVSQYRRFVDDGGYNESEFWKAGGFGQWQAPDKWEEQLQFSNRPVVGVNWFEAMAFCSWAGLSLPSEAQWERASRGPGEEYQKFPWGNEAPDAQRANYNAIRIGHASPVGVFPAGNAIWDKQNDLWLADMAGNVWEWCLDWVDVEYDKKSIFYEKTEGTKDPLNDEAGQLGKVGNQEYRVLRGGSWYRDGPQFLRCAHRNGLEPGLRGNSFGFRCICSRY